MQIDIVKVAEIIGAFSVILGVIIGGYKLYDILQEISDTLNKGQRKQILKNEKIKKAFDFFKVEYDTVKEDENK